MNTRKRIAAVAGASMLVLALAGTASADVVYATVTGHQASTSDDNNPALWGEDCVDLGVENVDSYELTASYDLVIVKAGSSNGSDPNAVTLFGDSPSAGETVWADTNGDGVFNVGGQDGDRQISHIIGCGEGETTTSSSSSTTTSETTSEETTTEETTTSETTTEETTTSETTTEETTTEETTTEETTTEETTTEETTTEETTSEQTTTSFSQTVSATTDVAGPTEPNTATFETSGPSSTNGSAWLLIVALGVLLGSVVILTPAQSKTKR